ncbi:MAG: alpha/beta hydrolase [Bacteriovoracaceae bacterium]|nr:alpha/beta hydrolase [Bacteriovoracaceae bacterium]
MKQHLLTCLTCLVIVFTATAKEGLGHLRCSTNLLDLNLINSNKLFAYNPQELTRWFKTKQRPTGVAIVVHGLNTRPSKMDDIAKALVKKGIKVLRVALSGHRGDIEELKSVTRPKWLKELFATYCLALKETKKHNIPIFYIGYSLGGMLGLDLMSIQSGELITFDKMLLFAPAITPHSYTRLIKLVKILGLSFIIPSFSPKAYKANPGTSVAAYMSTFASIDHFLKHSKDRLKKLNIPTIVYAEKNDELVSYNALSSFIHSNNFTNWKLTLVKSSNVFRHLIIDQKSLGSTQWSKFERDIDQMLIN